MSKMEFARGEQIAGKFEVIDLLDENPLGNVYRVKRMDNGEFQRLLLCNPNVANVDAKDQLIRAYKEAKRNKHDNLIKVGDLGDAGGLAYLTMEDFEGQTLRDLIQEHKIQGKPFDVKEAAQITIQMLEGISAATAAGFVFRGLRPEYVLIQVKRTGPRGNNFVAKVKLLYMGLWDLVPSATLAEDEFTRGEAQYIAPELKSFEPRPTERCDVYSIGVMFYEMIVGVAPVGTFQLPKTRRPDLPEHVNNVAELALAHSPDDRYQTAADFVHDIQRIFDGSAVQEKSNARFLTPLLVGGMFMAILAVFIVAVALFSFTQQDPMKVAEAKDNVLRKAMIEEVRSNLPSPDAMKKAVQGHPPNMAFVPGGAYLSGALEVEKVTETASKSDAVLERKEVPGFLIDLFEFPNSPKQPALLNVTQEEAKVKCESVGKRLCTANEWEKACKGPNQQAYSYGDTFDPDFCGNGLEEVYIPGARDLCRSDYGPFDMSGNYREWTSTEASSGKRVLVKGGTRAAADKGTRCAYAKDERMNLGDKAIGFRCCRDLSAPPWPPPAPKTP